MSEWHENFKNQLEGYLETYKGADSRYLNIKLLYQTATKIDEHSANCVECMAYKKLYQKTTDNLADVLENETARKQYEKMLCNTSKHLKKTHQIRVSNYYTSLYSFIGGLIGLLSVVTALFIAFGIIIHFTLWYGVFIGVTLGLIIGHYKDKVLKSKGKTMQV